MGCFIYLRNLQLIARAAQARVPPGDTQ